MKTKTKSIFFAICAMVLAMPAVALGQFTVPTGVEGVAEGKISDILLKVINGLLGLVGILGVLGFVVAGVMYLTAAGEEGKVETAKKTITWSIIGVVVALLGVVAINTIKTLVVGE